MSQEMQVAEQWLRGEIGKTGEPVPPEELIRRAQERHISPVDLRRALWHLVSLGELGFTGDMRVEPRAVAAG